jgi:microcin C transport system substrate-binding protein
MSKSMRTQNTTKTDFLLNALLMIMALGMTACGEGGKKPRTDPAKETFIPANFADLVAEDTEGKLVASGLVDADGNPHPLIAHSEEGVLEFYLKHPDAFRVKTLDELPKDLKWENGESEAIFSSPEAKRGGTWNMYENDFPRTLRFVGPDANGSFRGYIHDYNSIPLAQNHPGSDGYFPGTAKQWAVSTDGHTAFFQIDTDARYSDGQPLRISDFLYTFYFMRNKHINAPWYNDFYGKDKFTNITLFGKETLSISFYKAKPDMLERVSIRSIPEHFYGELDDEYLQDYQWKMEPTLGAYEVLEENIEKGKAITITRVKDWWADDKPFYLNRFNPERIRISVVRDPNKVFELFRKGDLDIHGLGLPEFWYDKLPDSAPEVTNGYIHKLTFYNQIPRPSWAIRINAGKTPLDNLDVRVGLHHAMNFQLVLDKVFRGDYQRMRTVADGYGPQTHQKLQARGFSIEKAETAFAKAGYTKRGPDGILQNPETRERLSITLTTGYKRMENVITVLKEEARKAGLELNLEILEGTAAWKKVNEKNHQIALTAFNVSVEMYPRFWEPFHSDNAYKEEGDSKYKADGSLKANLTTKTNTNNFTQTANKEVDQLINQYRKSEDISEITQLSHELAQQIHDHASWIPGWKKPWIRYGHWRWMEFPDDWGPKETRDVEEFHVFWIDEKKKAETLAARKNSKSFPKQIRSYEKHKTK